jgi:hypothetical protein
VGIGYGKSNQALGMGLPLTRKYIVFNTSIMRNTLQSIEFRRDLEYAQSDTATNAGNNAVAAQSGRTNSLLTAQFDYYF